MTFKKFISILTVISILFAFVPDHKVLAEDVTILNTIGDVLYSYTSDDLLSYENYDNYYDLVDNGLKYCVSINQHYVNNTNTSYLPSNLWNLVSNAYNDSSFKNISFHPDTPEGSLKFIIFFVGPSYSNLLELVSIEPQGDLYIVDGHLISDQPYTIYWVDYSFNIDTTNEQYVINTTPYNYGGDYKHISTNNTVSSNGVYETNYNNPSFFMYSEIPFYFTYSSNINYTDMNYLSQSPYNYQNYINVYNAIGNDETGFVIDRRTELMINGGSSDIVTPSQYGFKEGSFGNILYGGSYDNQKLMVGYELNDQSKSIQNQLALKLNYRYIFDGTIYSLPIYYDEDYYTNRGNYDIYSLKETNYINIDLSKVFFYMYENDQTYRDNLATVLDLKTNVLLNGGYRHKVVDGTPLYLFDILKSENILTEYVQNNDYDETFFESVSVTYKDVTVSPKFNINSIFEGEHSQTYTNTINNAQLIVTESILNLQTNEESSPCTFVYNYVNGTYNYIGTLETDDELFDNSYEYGGQSKNGYTSSDLGYDLSTYSFYPSSVSQGGNSSSTGNIVNVYPSQYPYVLVDIPENEWMSKTPNLTSILTDFKSMLAETKEDSVLTMLPQTYNYFPAPVMQYLLYGVGLIVMIGIWRAITRR